MPRKAKSTMSGAPGQAVGPVAGQQYGAGVEQMALQQAMPAPDARAAQPQPDPAMTAEPAMAPAPPSDAERFMQALSAAKSATPDTGLLARPTDRPNEPGTHGLAVGQGAGPEALTMRRGTPAGDTLRRLTEQTGDALFARLADRAGA